jgi:hypothetical protein
MLSLEQTLGIDKRFYVGAGDQDDTGPVVHSSEDEGEDDDGDDGYDGALSAQQDTTAAAIEAEAGDSDLDALLDDSTAEVASQPSGEPAPPAPAPPAAAPETEEGDDELDALLDF